VHAGLWWGDLRETVHVEDLGVDGRIILKYIFKKWGWTDMKWTDLAQRGTDGGHF
jgi:hypothetical protein